MAKNAREVKLIGDKQLLANLNAIVPNVKKRIMKAAVKKGAAVIAKRAKKKVRKRSGMLQKAIKYDATREGDGVVYVSTKKEGEYKGKKVKPKKYASLVEMGTRHAPAHPFMRPAQKEGRQEAFAAVTAEARKRFNLLAAQGKTVVR